MLNFIKVFIIASAALYSGNVFALHYMAHEETTMLSEMQETQKKMDDMMMKELGAKDATYDKRFIDLMIPHHEAAIMMAKDALENASHPEIKKMAQHIISAQEKEIKQLKAWRKQWYDKAATTH